MELHVVLLLMLATASWAMTVSMKEAEELPEELKPIMPGGSWFDDMAVKRLQRKHHDLKELGKLDGHRHEEDPEEMFIMARLASPSIVTIPEVGAPVTITPHPKQDTREAMREFLRNQAKHAHQNSDHHDKEDDEENDSKEGKISRVPPSSREFMEVYERELEKFFKNFMSAMLQAEIGGVSIETRSEDDRPNDVASS